MAKGFAKPIQSLLFIVLMAITLSCSKQKSAGSTGFQPSLGETFPVSSSVLKNCHFQETQPIYFSGQSITANPILCEEGVARSVTLLTPAALPTGLAFSMSQLSLTGTPTEKSLSAPYEFYIENEAGYAILKMQITVK